MLLEDHVTLLPVHVMTESSKWLIYPLEIPNWLLALMGTSYLALGLGTPAPCNSFPPGGPRGSSQVCVGEGCFAVCHRQWFENYSKKKLLQREERERNIERNQKAYKIDSTFFVINFNGHEITLSIFHKHFQMLTLYLFSLLTTSVNKQFRGRLYSRLPRKSMKSVLWDTLPPYSSWDACSRPPCWPQAPEAINWCVISLDQWLLQDLHLYLLPVTELLPGTEASKFFRLEMHIPPRDRHHPQWNLRGKHHRWDVHHRWTR